MEPPPAYVARRSDYMIVKIPRWDLNKFYGKPPYWFINEVGGRDRVDWAIV